MKYHLLGAVSTLAVGAAFGLLTPGAVNAGLVCSAGSNDTVGSSYTCKETISAGLGTMPTSNVLVLDQWLSQANAGYKQTLTGVDYTVSAKVVGGGSVIFVDTVSAVGSYSSGITLGAQNAGGAPSNFISPNLVTTRVIFGPKVTLAPGATTAYSLTTGVSSGEETVSGSLSGFVGAGTYSALVTAVLGSGGFAASPDGQHSANITTSASPTIQLTYNFTTSTTTPEPASLALFGVGLAGLGVVRRRRKA